MKIKKLFNLEIAVGVISMFALALALIVANSPIVDIYQSIHHAPIHVRLGVLIIEEPLVHWVNQGLMVIFFLVVGFEIKRQMFEGHLATKKQALLPAIAAIGGMAVPGAIFAAYNWVDPVGLRGWAVPTATDIVLALSVLSLLGSRVPMGLKVFLTAVAIFDDIGAVVVIGLFYGEHFSWVPFLLAVGAVICLAVLNQARVSHPMAYVVIGVVLWAAMMKAGLEAALAGVVIAIFVPMYSDNGRHHSPLRVAEKALHPWSILLVVPMFIFINAGLPIDDRAVDSLTTGVPLGIVLGLFLGKQIGVFGSVWLAVKSGMGVLPKGVNWLQIYGVSLLAGIGFTMSLFIASRAYPDPVLLGQAKLAVLIGSFLSAIFGLSIIKGSLSRKERGAVPLG